MRVLGLVLVAILAACATQLPPECKTEYAHTIAHCPPPKPRPAANVAECNSIRGVSIIEHGEFKACVSPSAAQQIFNRRLR